MQDHASVIKTQLTTFPKGVIVFLGNHICLFGYEVSALANMFEHMFPDSGV